MSSLDDSQSVESSVESQIQKMLKLIQEDLIKIKGELFAINSMSRCDGPLSVAIQNANDILINTAKENKIDIENLRDEDLDISASDTAFLNRISTMEVTQRIQQLLKE